MRTADAVSSPLQYDGNPGRTAKNPVKNPDSLVSQEAKYLRRLGIHISNAVDLRGADFTGTILKARTTIKITALDHDTT